MGNNVQQGTVDSLDGVRVGDYVEVVGLSRKVQYKFVEAIWVKNIFGKPDDKEIRWYFTDGTVACEQQLVTKMMISAKRAADRILRLIRNVDDIQELHRLVHRDICEACWGPWPCFCRRDD